MKCAKLFFAVLAAIIGIGGAYAFQPKGGKNAILARWYTVNGLYLFSGPTILAQAKCIGGRLTVCLIGTVAGFRYLTLMGEYH
jgi:hypothetical protein